MSLLKAHLFEVAYNSRQLMTLRHLCYGATTASEGRTLGPDRNMCTLLLKHRGTHCAAKCTTGVRVPAAIVLHGLSPQRFAAAPSSVLSCIVASSDKRPHWHQYQSCSTVPTNGYIYRPSCSVAHVYFDELLAFVPFCVISSRRRIERRPGMSTV